MTAEERAVRFQAGVKCWKGMSEENCQRRIETAVRHWRAKKAYERRKAELDKLERTASRLSFIVVSHSPYPDVCQTVQECNEKAEEMMADVRQAKKENWIQYQRAIGKEIPKESTIVEDYFRAKGWIKEGAKQ